ncbi:adenylyltransferase/cytidyltransferase family protein [bacterium]|nr:adenylyltransferase/cytidyltransferase family protein [candidate division CSSED10-310 bacterium]
MKITGQFQFLHPVNTSWIIDCQRIAHKLGENLRLLVHPGDVIPIDDLIGFLEAFHLADEVAEAGLDDKISDRAPSYPDIERARDIITQWYTPLISQRIFQSVNLFKPVLDSLRTMGVSLATTNGCFDILHPGHLKMLQSASQVGDVLIVLINGDESIRRFKGDARPIHAWQFRAALLTRLAAVSYVVVFDEDTPLDTLEAIRPEYHIKGGSFINERLRVERELLAGWGGILQTLPMTQSYSTSGLLERYPGPPFPV